MRKASLFSRHWRLCSSGNNLSEGEKKLAAILQTKFSGVKNVAVQDISGKSVLYSSHFINETPFSTIAKMF